MQRKNTRGYYSETLEVGNHILPMARMKKFTMSKVSKYVALIAIMYVVYYLFRKAGQPSNNTDAWTEERDANFDSNVNLENENQPVVDRRIKEEVKKVFEEFKQKHDERSEITHTIEVDQDLFGDYSDVNDNVGDDTDTIRVEEDTDMFNPDGEFTMDKEIEELLANAFQDAKDEAADDASDDQGKLAYLAQDLHTDEQHELGKSGAKSIEEPNDQQVFTKKEEFKLIVNNMGRQLNPLHIQQLNEKAQRHALTHDDDHEFPPFVTAVMETTVNQVTQLIASVQQFFPGRKIYIYDLNLEKRSKRTLMSYCGVKMRLFMKQLFPPYVSDLGKLHWKPLIIQTALAEFGHIIWVNPQYRLGTPELAGLIHESHEQGVLVIGQSAGYTTYSATHPDMLRFIPTDLKQLSNHPHVEIRAILIHNTPEVHEHIMKVFTACAMEESCLAPKGAKWQCRFDFTGRKRADCHRFDESALNILLKNWFNFDMARYVRRNNYFRKYDASYKPKLKTCRQADDIKDSEL